MCKTYFYVPQPCTIVRSVPPDRYVIITPTRPVGVWCDESHQLLKGKTRVIPETYLIPADVAGWRPALGEVEGLPRHLFGLKIEILRLGIV